MPPNPRARRAAFVLALLAAAAPARAGSYLEPVLGSGFGSTLYRIEMTTPLVDTNGTRVGGASNIGQSELEYPLDAPIAGLRWRQALGGEDAPDLTLAGWANLGQPGARMMDTDWLGARASEGTATSTLLYKFSYTRSRADLKRYGGEAGIGFGGLDLGTKPLRYGLAVRVEHLRYRLFGISGWHQFPQNPRESVDTLSDTLVLTYRLTRVMPRLFTTLSLAHTPRLTLLGTLTAGGSFAWDHDDHVLRFKYSDAYAWGFELGGQADLEIRLGARLALVLLGEFAYMRAKGESDQHFYADNPGSPGVDEKGLEYKDIRTRILALDGTATAGLRWRY